MGWNRVVRVLRGRRPRPPAAEDPSGPAAPRLEPVVNRDSLCGRYGQVPTQPGGNAWVWGVNTFFRPPVRAGEFPEDVAQTAGLCVPSVQNLETSLGSRFWFSVVRGASRQGAE